MKRIKMMLVSLALFAVVGGALAFKAKFDRPICYTIANQHSEGLTCPNLFVNSTIDPGATPIYFTTPAVNGACPATLTCGEQKVSLKQDF